MATRPIDEKIVAMKLDNSDFINKASETTKSMSKLTQFLNKIPGINLGKTTSELQNINKSINGIETSRLTTALDTVTSRFSTLGMIGTTALVNITNRAVDAGLAIARNLTVKPVQDGFREYELQMGSIQTILANTSKYGTTVADVTEALGELNEYADLTIYNFGEMTKNIGLFTNAGLELDESVSMIKGFSNAAAASGANAESAARAAYQLSQGLSQGYLMQMDWMSLTNAGMGNDNMKRDLIALGQAMGTLNEDTETAVRDWKSLLSDEQWLTTDVMSTYLQAMAGELDKATLMTVGLSEAQADLLIQNAKTGEEAATYVRTFTQMMSTLAEGVGSGWSESWRIIFGDFEHATKLWSGFSELISEPFTRLTESRNKFFQSLKDAGVFEEIFVGIGTAIYLVGQVVDAVADGFDKAFASDKVGIVSAFANGFKKVVDVLTPSQAALDKISLIFQALGSTVRVVMKILGDVGSLLLKLVPDNLGTTLLDIVSGFAKMIISFNDAILKGEGIRAAFENLGDAFSWMGDRIGDVLGSLSQLGDYISEVWEILRTGEAATNGAFSEDSKVVIWLTAISDAAKNVVGAISDIEFSMAPITNAFEKFFTAIGNGFQWLRDKFSAAGEAIKSVMPSGTSIVAGGFIAALITVVGIAFKRMNDLSKIFSEWGNVVQGFAETLDSVSGVLDAFALNIHAQSLLIAAFAVGALAGSIFLLSKIDGGKIGTSLTGIVGSLMAVIGALSIMNKYNITGGFSTSASIIGVAIALSIMTIALKKFGALKPEELTKGLIAITVVLGAVAGSFALMGKFNDKQIAASAAQIVAISISVLLITKAVKTMSDMEPEKLTKGLLGLGTMLIAISGAFALMGKFSSGGGASALQMLAMAGSIVILVGAIKIISGIETKDLLIGLGTITAILAAVAGFSIVTSGKGLLQSSIGLLAIAVAINALIIPIFALGNFPLENLLKGLLGMSVALLAIAAASKLMNGSLVGAISITLMAAALNLLFIPIAAFAAMGWGAMLTGIAGLVLTLAGLAGVSLLLAPATVPLLLFSAAIAALGIAMLAAGAGMALFGTGLVALAGLTSAAITTLIATMGALITGLVSLIPGAVKFVTDIIIQVAKTIQDKSPEITAIVADTLLEILTVITKYVPKFVKAVVKLITTLLDALSEEYPKIIDSAVDMLVTMVEHMARTIEREGPRFVNAFLDIFESVLTMMTEVGVAVVDAMFGWIPGVGEAMKEIGETAGDRIAEALDAARRGEEEGQKFADGLSSKEYTVQESGKILATAANSGLTSSNSMAAGGMFASNFATGMLNNKYEVMRASAALGGAAEKGIDDSLDINSPSGVGMDKGENLGGSVAMGMDNTSGLVEKSSANMASSATSGFSGITDMIRDKLFLKDSDVKENDKKTKEISKSHENLSKEVAKSTKSSTKAQTDGTKAVSKGLDEQFTKARDLIEENKYYQRLSLEEELKAWQDIQKKYKEGTEERRLADREVFRVQQDMIKAKADAEKAAFKHSKEWIEKEKTFKKMSLADELAGWERVQARYDAGSEERKEADREVLRVKNEINQRLTDLNDEYVTNIKETNKALIEEEQRLNEEYQRTYDDRVRSLTNFVGLFDKVKQQDAENPITGNQLLDNLRGQVDSIATWADDLQRLTQKGIDEGLLSELQQMGPSAALEIAALNSLTAGQLDQYVELWRKKSEIASNQATLELRPLLDETNATIKQLRKDTTTQLNVYRDEWARKIAEIKEGAKEGFVGLTTDMKTIGGDAIDGLIEGLAGRESPLYGKVQDIAQGIEWTIKNTLKIKSPSRVLMALGLFAGQGLANGIENAKNTVSEKSKALALTARDAINKFISTMNSPDFSNEIHFKAVLDDSEVANGVKNLNNSNVPYFLGTTNALVSSVKSSFRQNGNKTARQDESSSSSDPNVNRPIILQSILNGRIVAEETYGAVSELINGQTNLAYFTKGV